MPENNTLRGAFWPVIGVVILTIAVLFVIYAVVEQRSQWQRNISAAERAMGSYKLALGSVSVDNLSDEAVHFGLLGLASVNSVAYVKFESDRGKIFEQVNPTLPSKGINGLYCERNLSTQTSIGALTVCVSNPTSAVRNYSQYAVLLTILIALVIGSWVIFQRIIKFMVRPLRDINNKISSVDAFYSPDTQSWLSGREMVGKSWAEISELKQNLEQIAAQTTTPVTGILELFDAAPFALIVTDSEYIVFAYNSSAIGFFQNNGPMRVGCDLAEFLPAEELVLDKECKQISTCGERFVELVGTTVTSDSIEYNLYLLKDVSEFRSLAKEAQKLASARAMEGLSVRMVHDFNNQIAVIRANAALAVESKCGPVSVYLESIESACEQATRLTSFWSGQGHLALDNNEIVDVAEQVRKIELVIRRQLPPNIQLHVDINSAGVINVDKSRFRTAVQSLVTNAWESMPQGGVLEMQVTDDQLNGKAVVVVSVTDTGVGIEEYALPDVQMPYYTSKPSGQGFGLGLAVVAEFAQRAQGAVEIESAKGLGTSATLVLPVVEQVTGAKTEVLIESLQLGQGNVEAQQQQGDKLKVLIVEDQQHLMETLAEIVSFSGHEVKCADSYEQVQALIAVGGCYDIVLCDVLLPGFTAVDVWGLFEEDRPGFVFMSGGISATLRSQLEGLKPFRILQKPFSMKAMLTLLSEFSKHLVEENPR